MTETIRKFNAEIHGELNIYQRIHAIMEDVKYIQKEDKKVNGQYTYVSHDAVTKKIRDAMVKHRVINEVKTYNITQDGNRTECEMEVTFINIDKPEERHPCNSFGYGIDPQDKGPGKAMSYAYKMALLKTFALETGEDAEKDMIDHEADDWGKEAQDAYFEQTKGAFMDCPTLKALEEEFKLYYPDRKKVSGKQHQELLDIKNGRKDTFQKEAS